MRKLLLFPVQAEGCRVAEVWPVWEHHALLCSSMPLRCSAALSAAVGPQGSSAGTAAMRGDVPSAPSPRNRSPGGGMKARCVWSPSEQSALMNAGVHVLWKACRQAVQQQVTLKGVRIFSLGGEYEILLGNIEMAGFSAVLKREAACNCQLSAALVSGLSCMQGKIHFLEMTIFLLPNF